MLTAKKLGSMDEEIETCMFTNLAKFSAESLNSIDLFDYVKLQQAYQGFLSSPLSSPKPSASS
jgi:hypothetical protein